MSSALLAALFVVLGLGLAVTSTACFMLWQKGRAVSSATVAQPSPARSTTISVALPGQGAEKWPVQVQVHSDLARRLDELASRYDALEARLARIEALAGGADRIDREPGGTRFGRRVDPGQNAISEGPTLISVPNLAAPPSLNSEAMAGLDRRFGPIWAMADEGMPTEAIARETGYPIGQVELILGLRRQLLVGGAGLDG